MEIILAVALVAVAAVIGFKIIQKQRSQDQHPLDSITPTYPKDSGPVPQEVITQIKDMAEKPVAAETKSEIFTGFPKSEPAVNTEQKSEPAKKPRGKKAKESPKSNKSQSGNTQKKKTKKTA